MRLFHLFFSLGCLALLITRWRKDRGSWRQRLGFQPYPRKLRDFVIGCLMGLLAMLVIFGVEWACGWLQPGPFIRAGLSGLDILPPLAMMALWEELRFRGIEFSGLRTLLPPWGALAVSAAVFGAAHGINAHATALSILGNMVGGMVYGYAFLASGAIWLPFGIHAAWNAVQGPILGLPISGYVEGGLWRPVVSGPKALTGGAYGPEAGLTGLVAHLLILALVWGYLRKNDPEPSPMEFPCSSKSSVPVAPSAKPF